MKTSIFFTTHEQLFFITQIAHIFCQKVEILLAERLNCKSSILLPPLIFCIYPSRLLPNQNMLEIFLQKYDLIQPTVLWSAFSLSTIYKTSFHVKKKIYVFIC